MTRVLLLIPTTSYRASDFVNAAYRLGVEVVVGSNRRQAIEAGATTTIDFRDVAKGARQIAAYARDRPLDAVVGVDDETALLAATASEILGLAHNPPEAVATHQLSGF